MNESSPPAWKPELDAIVGARHGGQVSGVLDQLKNMAERFPQVAEVHHQLAWTHDVLDQPRLAVPHYEKAIALGLPPNELSGALLSLGSSLRLTGQLDRSLEVLESGRRQFPNHQEFRVFLALTQHDRGTPTTAVQTLLSVLLDTCEDPGINAYQRALRHHGERLQPAAHSLKN